MAEAILVLSRHEDKSESLGLDRTQALLAYRQPRPPQQQYLAQKLAQKPLALGSVPLLLGHQALDSEQKSREHLP